MSNFADHKRTASSSAEQHPSMDELFDVLSHNRRRTVLTVLAERGVTVDVESLAAAVAEREDDADEETVHVRLHHVHLPKLDDAGLVNYDRDSHTVGVTDAGTPGVPIDIE